MKSKIDTAYASLHNLERSGANREDVERISIGLDLANAVCLKFKGLSIDDIAMIIAQERFDFIWIDNIMKKLIDAFELPMDTYKELEKAMKPNLKWEEIFNLVIEHYVKLLEVRNEE